MLIRKDNDNIYKFKKENNYLDLHSSTGYGT